MDTATLAQAMGHSVSPARYAELTPAFNRALAQAGCTTINRAAMFCAQVGHESVGLKYMQEIASGVAYNGRKDLGNIYPGDGPRFKGHGPLQITGRHNHAAVSRWAHSKGYVPSPTYFVDDPLALASVHHGLLGAVWYWTVARPALNSYADRADLNAATRAINGGTNGWADRVSRWNRCRVMGARLLPTGGGDIEPEGDDELRDDERTALIGIYHQMSGSPQPGKWPGWPSFRKGQPSATLLDFIRRQEDALARIEAKVDAFIAGRP